MGSLPGQYYSVFGLPSGRRSRLPGCPTISVPPNGVRQRLVPAHLDNSWFIEPTVFYDVDNAMRIAREEILGPVLSVIPYETEDDAVRIANDSDYGVSGSVWTADVDHGAQVRRPTAYRRRPGQFGAAARLQGSVRRLQEVGHRPRVRTRGRRSSISRSSTPAERRPAPIRRGPGGRFPANKICCSTGFQAPPSLRYAGKRIGVRLPAISRR